MLQDMMKALDDANGVTQDIWLHILGVMGDDDPSVKNVQCFGGRYYLTADRAARLKDMLPFMAGTKLDRIGGAQLTLPAHEPEPVIECRKCKQPTKRVSDGGFMAYMCDNTDCSYKDIKIRYSIDVALRCGRCKGPFHPATGHAFNATIVACGVCYGKFICWQMSKYGWRPLTNKQKKKLNAKRKKQEKIEAAIGRDLARKAIKEAEEQEKLYGKPREVQQGLSVKDYHKQLLERAEGQNPIWNR